MEKNRSQWNEKVEREKSGIDNVGTRTRTCNIGVSAIWQKLGAVKIGHAMDKLIAQEMYVILYSISGMVWYNTCMHGQIKIIYFAAQ